jgi:mRNA interferase YafQ
MLALKPSSQFKKDFKKLSKSGKYDLGELKRVIDALAQEEELDPSVHRPHKLIGNWKGYMECHIVSISSDWLLLYRMDETEKLLKLARTGSHSELFG